MVGKIRGFLRMHAARRLSVRFPRLHTAMSNITNRKELMPKKTDSRNVGSNSRDRELPEVSAESQHRADYDRVHLGGMQYQVKLGTSSLAPEDNLYGYQNGKIDLKTKKSNAAVWVFKWLELASDGRRIKRKHVIGTKLQLPTKAAVLREIKRMRLNVDSRARSTTLAPTTVNALIEHYRLAELGELSQKTLRTRQVYTHQLIDVITPRWGRFQLEEVKPILVERWLEQLPVAAGSKAKTKGVLNVLFQHALRYELVDRNPIRLVRQSAKPQHDQIVLTPVEIAAMLQELRDPFRTLLLLAAVTGLRRGELFGLKWEDLDFSQGEIRVLRSLVDQTEGPPKTLASRSPVPMSQGLSSSLSAWREVTHFASPKDWVFASPQSLGKLPYWPDAVLKRHVLPAAMRAGIEKQIGWHTFRRTLATLLQSSGASVKTTQELLRHASPALTLGIYAKAITADKRRAQDGIAAAILQG